MKPTTAAIVAGSRSPVSAAHPLVAPVFTSAVGWFEDSELLDASLDGKDYVYTRIAAQNAALLEEAVAALEGAEACVAYATGMAALRGGLRGADAQARRSGGDAGDGYGATRALYKKLCAERGARAGPVDARRRRTHPADRRARARSWCWPRASPTRCSPCRTCARWPRPASRWARCSRSMPPSRPRSAQRALALGADYAIQSTTKWINGHSDAMGGTVSGARERASTALAARRALDGRCARALRGVADAARRCARCRCG